MAEILMQIIELHVKAFHRIDNINIWMKTNDCLDPPNEIDGNVGKIELEPIILVLLPADLKDKIHFFDKTDIKNIRSFHSNSIIVQIDNSRERRNPIVIILVLNPDEQGQLSKHDKQLLDLLNATKKNVVSSDDVIFAINYTKARRNNDFLLEISEQVQSHLDLQRKTIYERIFHISDCDLQKRIALIVEQNVNFQISECSNSILYLKKSLVCDTGDTAECEHTKNYITSITKLSDLTGKTVPDPYELHVCEVLLQRNSNISAFTLSGTEIQVFTNDRDAVNTYIDKYFEAKKCKLKLRAWSGLPEITKFSAKQGSKVRTSADSESDFGTIGLFIRDGHKNIYFTTCAHVLGLKEEAFTNSDTAAIGRSVFAPQRDTFSITDSIDLSLVKVYQKRIVDCSLGLRNTNGQMVEGTISVAEKSEMRDMKVYKWGAKTNLTRETYKGCLCIRKGDRFDSHIHYIEGDYGNIFAEEGDSGSLVCFEAQSSPQFQCDTAAFIFVGKQTTNYEYMPEGTEEAFPAFCYHVSEVFKCDVSQTIPDMEACLKPTQMQ